MKYAKLFSSIFMFSLLSSIFLFPAEAKSIDTPWVGLQIGELTQDLSVKYGYYPNDGGAFVHYVFVAGPAGQAGLKSGDIIIAVDGKAVHSPKELAGYISGINYEREIEITLIRNSSEKNFTVKVINNPYPGSSGSQSKDDKPWFGITLRNVTKEMSEIWNLPVTSGLLVITVYEDSSAYNAGIQEGDIIVEVEGENIKTYEELLAIVTPIKPGKTITLGLWHNGSKINCKVTF